MTQAQSTSLSSSVKRTVAFGLAAVFLTRFISMFFMGAITIAQPAMVAEFDGISLFSWYLALPALAGAISTLLFGKLSDMYGRRALMLLSMLLFIIGAAMTALSTSMTLVIAARIVMSLGQAALPAITSSIIGDMFSPVERAKWVGLLNIPGVIASALAPTIGGLVTQSTVGWRGIFWGVLPLMLIAIPLAAIGAPGRKGQHRQKIDLAGTIVMAMASTALIIGAPWLGEPGKVGQGIALLAASGLIWVMFVRVEKKAEAPILDLQVLFNRSFLTVAGSSFFSFFGLLGVTTYSPIFVQKVMGVSPLVSGSMLTPYNILMSIIGIPVGFLLARTKKYKGMYIAGYGIMTISMFLVCLFNANTPIWFYILVTSVAGFGLGAIPTLNLLVVQFTVPKHLLGVAVGALFFFLSMGMAVVPSLLGLVQNTVPDLEAGLKVIFWVGAITMALSFLIITTIPEVSMSSED